MADNTPQLFPIIVLPAVSKMHVRVGKFIYNPFVNEHVYENRVLTPQELNKIADDIFLDQRLPRRPSIRMVTLEALAAPAPLEAVERPVQEASSMFPGSVLSKLPMDAAPAPPAESPAENPMESQDNDDEEEIDITELAWQFAQDQGVDVSTISGTGAGGRITKKDVEAAVATRAA